MKWPEQTRPRQTPQLRMSSALSPQPYDDVNAGDFITFWRSRRLADDHLGPRDVEYRIFAFNKEMMMRGRVGIEIGFRPIDCDLTEKADFGELMQCIVDGRQ